jgi:hypothetical protein
MCFGPRVVFKKQKQMPCIKKNSMAAYAAHWVEIAVIIILSLYGLLACLGCIGIMMNASQKNKPMFRRNGSNSDMMMMMDPQQHSQPMMDAYYPLQPPAGLGS